MDCHEVSARIRAFIDDKMDLAVARAMADHFRECLKCRKELEELSSIHPLIKRLPRYEVPASFAKRVLSMVREMDTRRQTQTFLQRTGTQLLSFVEKFSNVLNPASSPSTHALEEFNDVPASFIGYAYFRILN